MKASLFFSPLILSLLSGCGDGDKEWISQQEKPVRDILNDKSSQHADYQDFLKHYADVLRAEGEMNPDDKSTQSVLNSFKDMTKATDSFGQTTIDMKKLPLRSGVARIDGASPWSGWWYPRFEGALFRNSKIKELSPLKKLDLYQESRLHRRTSSADTESRSYNSIVPRWEGLCDAWAFASILSPEPKREVMAGKIKFNISDLKALLLKTYDNIDDSALEYYGQRFTGDQDGWIYADLFPDQVHRFIEVQLFQKHQPFIMDHDPGVENWNEPVVGANYVLESIADHRNAVRVRLWLYSVTPTPSNDSDFVGAIETSREYDYILFGKLDENKILAVTSGIWIKDPHGVDSRKDHPDYFIVISHPERITRQSKNSEINTELVDELIRGAL